MELTDFNLNFSVKTFFPERWAQNYCSTKPFGGVWEEVEMVQSGVWDPKREGPGTNHWPEWEIPAHNAVCRRDRLSWPLWEYLLFHLFCLFSGNVLYITLVSVCKWHDPGLEKYWKYSFCKAFSWILGDNILLLTYSITIGNYIYIYIFSNNNSIKQYCY